MNKQTFYKLFSAIGFFKNPQLTRLTIIVMILVISLLLPGAALASGVGGGGPGG